MNIIQIFLLSILTMIACRLLVLIHWIFGLVWIAAFITFIITGAKLILVLV